MAKKCECDKCKNYKYPDTVLKPTQVPDLLLCNLTFLNAIDKSVLDSFLEKVHDSIHYTEVSLLDNEWKKEQKATDEYSDDYYFANVTTFIWCRVWTNTTVAEETYWSDLL